MLVSVFVIYILSQPEDGTRFVADEAVHCGPCSYHGCRICFWMFVAFELYWSFSLPSDSCSPRESDPVRGEVLQLLPSCDHKIRQVRTSTNLSV